MQSVTQASVTKSDIATLFGTDTSVIDQWLEAGLPMTADGRVLITTACRWLRRHHTEQLEKRPEIHRLTQKQLCRLLGLSRQTVCLWTSAGMPSENGVYDLHEVIAWLPGHYQRESEQRLKKRLRAIQKKLQRNLAQCSRFVEGGKME